MLGIPVRNPEKEIVNINESQFSTIFRDYLVDFE